MEVVSHVIVIMIVLMEFKQNVIKVPVLNPVVLIQIARNLIMLSVLINYVLPALKINNVK